MENKKEKVLGVDLGRRRIGIAVGYRQGPVFRSKTLNVENANYLDFLVKEIEEQQVDRVVFGLPLSKEGESTKQSNWIEEIASKLGEKTDVKIDFVDEYLTSWQAKTEGAQAEEIDQAAAEMILKDYFNE